MTEETLIQNTFFAEDDNLSQPVEPQIEPELKRDLICEAADEMKAQNITILDVREITTLADYFVMCSGTSTTHIQSIAGGVRDRLRERARQRAKVEGDAASLWIILDYGDVILHVFDEETREFYDLERLWADAKASVHEAPGSANGDTANGDAGNSITGNNGETEDENRFRQSPARQTI